MELSRFAWYLIIINVVGFVFFLINTLLYMFTDELQIDSLLTLVSVLGGSLGIVIAILIFDRKLQKGNMMSRVFVICILIIQIIILLVLKGYIAKDLNLAFWTFFDKHKILLTYLVVINFVTMVVFAVDKIAAIEHTSRIRIVTLLGLSFVGGSIGAIIAMYVFRHKTRIDYFTVGVPLIIIMQIFVLFYTMNFSWG